MIDLYHFPSPNGWKASIMLEECSLPYRLIMIDLTKNEQTKPEYLRINPNNKVPAIVDRDPGGNPNPIFESGAVLIYLAEKSGKFMPASGPGRWEVLKWLFWQVGGLGPM